MYVDSQPAKPFREYTIVKIVKNYNFNIINIIYDSSVVLTFKLFNCDYGLTFLNLEGSRIV